MRTLDRAVRTRPGITAWYSGEWYQRLACSAFSNSITAMRFGRQSPSRTSIWPPRTMCLPPYCRTPTSFGQPMKSRTTRLNLSGFSMNMK